MSYLDQLISQSGLALAAGATPVVEAEPPILEVEAQQVFIPAGITEPVVAAVGVEQMTDVPSNPTGRSERAPLQTQMNSVDERAADAIRPSSGDALPAPPAEIVIGVREIERVVPAPPSTTAETAVIAPAPVSATTALPESRPVDRPGEPAATPVDTEPTPPVPARRPTILDVRRWVAAPLSVEEVEQRVDGAGHDGAVVPAVIPSNTTPERVQVPAAHTITVEPPPAHVELSIGTVHVTIEGTPQTTAAIAVAAAPAPAIEPMPAWSRLARRYLRA